MKPILVQAHELAIAHGISSEDAIAMPANPSLDGDRIIFEWEVPEDYPRIKSRCDDVAEAYCITENEEAASGIMIWAKYHGKWSCNPTNVRPLVKYLWQVGFNRIEDQDDTEDVIAINQEIKEMIEAIKSLDIYEYRNLSDEEIADKHIALTKDLLELSDSYPAAKLALSYLSSFMFQFHQSKRQQTEDAIAPQSSKQWNEDAIQSLIVRPIKYGSETEHGVDAITVEALNQEDGTRLWGIFKGSRYAMSKLDGKFHWIPSPSNRPDNYQDVFRWDSAQGAFDFAVKMLERNDNALQEDNQNDN